MNLICVKMTSAAFGHRLAAIRKHRGFSQAELAAAMRKSNRTISAWENALIGITPDDVTKIAYALRSGYADLLAPPGAPTPRRAFLQAPALATAAT